MEAWTNPLFHSCFHVAFENFSFVSALKAWGVDVCTHKAPASVRKIPKNATLSISVIAHRAGHFMHQEMDLL